MRGRKRQKDTADKRGAILDAAEQIMREEGYAAVTARRVADRAGLKSTPVHYHFGSMDELFLALYRRSEEKYLSRLVAALSSETPLKDFWRLERDPIDAGLLGEYLALANHRPVIKDEVMRSGERTRVIKTAIIKLNFDSLKIEFQKASPEVLTFIIDAIGRMLVSEGNIGIKSVHREVEDYIYVILNQLEPTKSGPHARPGGSEIPPS